VESAARRLEAIETGAQVVVGVNAYRDSEPSPLTAGGDAGFLAPDPAAEAGQIENLAAWRAARDRGAVDRALADLEAAAREGVNIMEPSVACAHAGVTTGEWGETLRKVFGEYRAPTGVGGSAAAHSPAEEDALAPVRERVEAVSRRLGRRLKMLVGKPGLDGHSNGAEQIAVRARDAGFEVVYEGIRLTPAQIVGAALEEGVHVIGLSILSGSHVDLAGDVLARMEKAGLARVPLVAGGIIPAEDAAALRKAGVAAVYTPKDYDLTAILADIVDIVDRATEEAA
jgi:(2R)-ethylmalonyl-CoA mutase